MLCAFRTSSLLFALFAASAHANGDFLAAPEVQVKKIQFVEEVYVSLFTHVTPKSVQRVERHLEHRFNAMPKNANGAIQGSPLHYLAHTYFLKQHGWLLRGLDPHRLGTYNTSARMFERDDFAAYLEHFISSVTKGAGFDLEFSSAFVVVLEDFVMSEGVDRLEAAYKLNGLPDHVALSREQLHYVLDTYLALQSNYASKAHDPVKYKQSLQSFFNSLGGNQSDMLAQDVLQTAVLHYKHRGNPFLAEQWSFQQASEVVKELAYQYGDIREQECQELKSTLADMDPAGTGRVPIGRFYSKKSVGRWSLEESVEYLRQLGALDESVPDRAPRVIIPNYVTAVSNCEPVSMYYSLCCIHECEEILGYFEMHIQKPTALPSEILALLSSATSFSPRNLSAALVGALEQVASVHAGEVPLHGRLFAQWLHYVFPQDCPYPHMSQKVRPLSPHEWFGGGAKQVIASQKEVDKYVQDEVKSLLSQDSAANVSDATQLSQWTLDEEMSWELHDGSRPIDSPDAKFTVVISFAKGLAMVTIFALVVGKELRRGFRAAFKSAKQIPDGLEGEGGPYCNPLTTIGRMASWFQTLLKVR